MSRRIPAPWALALFVGLASACSEDGTPDPALVDRFCDGFCTKAAECGFLLGGTKDACVTTCKTNASGGSGGSTCSPSQAQVDACLNDLTTAACTALEDGVPSCEAICPEPDAGGDAGTPLRDATADSQCTELAACCPNVPETGGLRDSCWQISARNIGSVCGSLVADHEAAGYCGAGADAGPRPDATTTDATPMTDAGPRPDATTTDATPMTDAGPRPDAAAPAECTRLLACCPTLDPSDQPGCEATVAFNNAVGCAAAYGAFCSGADAGEPEDAGTSEDAEAPVDAGPPDSGFVSEPSCVELLACCPTLPNNPLREGCSLTATTNFDVICSQGLASYRQSGFCGAGDGGTPPDAGPGCELLAACCPTVSSELQEPCTSIVGLGDVSLCLDTLRSFQDNEFCL